MRVCGALDGRHGIRTMGSVGRGAAREVEAVGRAVTAAVLAAAMAASAVRMATAVCRDFQTEREVAEMAVVALVALAAAETLVGGVARVTLAAQEEAGCHCCWRRWRSHCRHRRGRAHRIAALVVSTGQSRQGQRLAVQT